MERHVVFLAANGQDAGPVEQALQAAGIAVHRCPSHAELEAHLQQHGGAVAGVLLLSEAALTPATLDLLRGYPADAHQAPLPERQRDAFLATLAHELRNPLAPILNVASIFERLHPSEQTTQLADMVRRQVAQLTRLIADIATEARAHGASHALQRTGTPVEAAASPQSGADPAGGPKP